jgi:predicted Fe-S protein YdhL (DUF1289 family)
MKFNPCTGKCTQDGTHCEGCGRTHEEVAATKKIVKDMVNYIQEKNYENPEEFTNSIAHGVMYKLQEAKEATEAT